MLHEKTVSKTVINKRIVINRSLYRSMRNKINEKQDTEWSKANQKLN